MTVIAAAPFDFDIQHPSHWQWLPSLNLPPFQSISILALVLIILLACLALRLRVRRKPSPNDEVSGKPGVGVSGEPIEKAGHTSGAGSEKAGGVPRSWWPPLRIPIQLENPGMPVSLVLPPGLPPQRGVLRAAPTLRQAAPAPARPVRPTHVRSASTRGPIALPPMEEKPLSAAKLIMSRHVSFCDRQIVAVHALLWIMHVLEAVVSTRLLSVFRSIYTECVRGIGASVSSLLSST